MSTDAHRETEHPQCQGCGRHELHKMCPACGTPIYCDPKHPEWGKATDERLEILRQEQECKDAFDAGRSRPLQEVIDELREKVEQPAKTPGQVAYEAYRSELFTTKGLRFDELEGRTQAAWQAAAAAVTKDLQAADEDKAKVAANKNTVAKFLNSPDREGCQESRRELAEAFGLFDHKKCCTAFTAKLSAAEQHLGNLLARIHGDGGHYYQEHGAKAVEDADAKYCQMLTRMDSLRAALERVTEDVEAGIEVAETALRGADFGNAARRFIARSAGSLRQAREAMGEGAQQYRSPAGNDSMLCSLLSRLASALEAERHTLFDSHTHHGEFDRDEHGDAAREQIEIWDALIREAGIWEGDG